MKQTTLKNINFLLILLLAFTSAKAQTEVIKPLLPEQTIERELAGGQTHKYKFDAKANEFLQIKVEQKGIDVVVRLFDSDGKQLAEMDSPNGTQGFEDLTFIISNAGIYTIEISSWEANAAKGTYIIFQASPRTATEKDYKQQSINKLFSETDLLIRENNPTSFQNALIKLKKVNQICIELENKDCEAKSLYLLAIVNAPLGKSQEVTEYYEQALKIYRLLDNSVQVANILTELGNKHIFSGNVDKAFEYFNEALPIHKKTTNKVGEADTLMGLYWIFSLKGENEKALQIANEALELYRSADFKQGEAFTLKNIAILYIALNNAEKRLEYLNKALIIFKLLKDKLNEALISQEIGDIYFNQNNYEKALENLKEALLIFKELKNIDQTKQVENSINNINNILTKKETSSDQAENKLTADKMTQAATLLQTGYTYFLNEEYEKAIEYAKQSLVFFKDNDLKFYIGMANLVIGNSYTKLGKYQNAAEHLENSLNIWREADVKFGEALTLFLYMVLFENSKNNYLAILYGKSSVNILQGLRGKNAGLDKNSQQSFLKSIQNPYRLLAELLIREGRIAEAEQVLQMLKEEEVFDYLRRDASETDKLSQRIDLDPKEKEALKRYEKIADQITALGKKFAELEKLGENRTTEQEKRFNEIAVQLEDANRSFQVFLRELADEFKKRTNTEKDLQENLALQSDLKKWGDDIVFIYTLVGEDRFRTILVTSDTQADGKTEIKAADLNKKIADFRAALQNPQIDPRPLGKELYDILIKPIEKQLDGAKAKTLLWSLDGNLRLLPLAALWDGKQYFGQKYENVTVTLASRTRLGDPVSKDWRVLGLGVSEGKTVKQPDGTRDITFAPLFAVKKELTSIVKSTPEETGVLPGNRLLNSEFTESGLKKELPKGYKVVHIASHFSLNPGDATQSFLLLGDGTVLTVNAIKISPQIRFDGVELLTLSACQTAVVEKDSTGKEIEGFGYVAQQKGAEAILATLWNVADESTQMFMSEFYRLRKENPQMTKTEAIRLAQKSMIEGKLKSSGKQTGCRSEIIKVDGTQQTSYKCDANAPFAHPYFWSPFVLIGNWK